MPPRKPEKVYRDVIMMIDGIRDSHNRPSPFAIWEIVEVTKYSSSQISRVLKELVFLGYVIKLRTGYNNRVYKVAPKWTKTTQGKIIELYELHRLVSARG